MIAEKFLNTFTVILNKAKWAVDEEEYLYALDGLFKVTKTYKELEN